jgi:hypothetical protein
VVLVAYPHFAAMAVRDTMKFDGWRPSSQALVEGWERRPVYSTDPDKPARRAARHRTTGEGGPRRPVDPPATPADEASDRRSDLRDLVGSRQVPDGGTPTVFGPLWKWRFRADLEYSTAFSVLKTAAVTSRRGFESLSLRQAGFEYESGLI